MSLSAHGFSDGDIGFLIEAVEPGLKDRAGIIKSDPVFVESLLERGALEALRRIMLLTDDQLLVSISPRFLFEIMLRAARRELSSRPYTIERNALERIPVFDSKEVLEFIDDDRIVKYLADMLTSFTRIRSMTWPIRVRKGVWRRVRFNDMDVDSLLRYCETLDEAERFSTYKRIGDVCLFLVGIFPEYTGAGTDPVRARGPSMLFGRQLRPLRDYEEEGSRFYALASRHPDARAAGLEDILGRLSEKFHLAEKPLGFISEHYLQFRKGKLFGTGS